MKTTFLAVALSAIVVSPALADDREMPTVLFQGYDTFTGAVKGSLLKGTVSAPTDGGSGCQIKLCESASEVHKALQIDASAEASAGTVSASASASYASSLDISENSVVLVVYATRQSTTKAQNPKFGHRLTKARLVDDFKTYGDSWVKEITTGSEYYATFNFTASNKVEKESLKASLSGTVGKVSASTAAAIANAQTTTASSLTFNQKLRGVSKTQLPAAETQKIIEFALAFPTVEADAPAPISARTEGYEKIMEAALAVAVEPVVKNRDLFFKSHASNDDTTATGGWENKLQQLKNADLMIDMIVKTYNFYDYKGDPLPAQASPLVKNDIDRLEDFLFKVSANPWVNPRHITLRCLSFGVPQLRFKLHDVVLGVGQEGDEPFRDVDRSTVKDGVRIGKITTIGGYLVDSIWVDYNIGGKSQTLQHGGKRTSPARPEGDNQNLTLDEGEYISSIKAEFGNTKTFNKVFLYRISFETNKGKKLPYTDAGSDVRGSQLVTWTAKEGERLVGFAGRSAWFVNSLQAIVVAWSPARWTGRLHDNPKLLPHATNPPPHVTNRSPNAGAPPTKYTIEGGGSFVRTGNKEWLLTQKSGKTSKLTEVRQKGEWLILHEAGEKNRSLRLPIAGGHVETRPDGEDDWTKMAFKVKRD